MHVLFAEAVQSDARVRDRLAYAKEPYLHSLQVPLAHGVALTEAALATEGSGKASQMRASGAAGDKDAAAYPPLHPIPCWLKPCKLRQHLYVKYT